MTAFCSILFMSRVRGAATWLLLPLQMIKNRFPFFARLTCLAALLLCLVVTTGQADLAVRLPYGTPLDWSLWRSSPMALSDIPSLTLGPVNAEESAGSIDPRITQDSPERQYKKLTDAVIDSARFGITLDPWSESFITTKDVGNHLRWFRTVGQTSTGKPTVSLTRYKPEVDHATRMRVLGMFVQLHLHRRHRISMMESLAHLVEIGQPALFSAINVSEDSEGLQDSALYVAETIGKPVQRLEKIRKEKDESVQSVFYRRMLQDELSSGYAYGFDPAFGRTILEMGSEVLPTLVKTAFQHKHPVVRHNAVAMLDSFDDALAVKALRKLLTRRDAVSRNRALMSLTRRKDVTIVPFLLKTIKSPSQYYFQFSAAYALGVIGDRDTIPALVEWATPHLNQGIDNHSIDVSWVLFPALLRLRADSKGAKALYKIGRREWSVTTPLGQLCRMGLAVNGHKKAREELQVYMGSTGLLALHPGVVPVMLEALVARPDVFDYNYIRQALLSRKFPVNYQALKLSPFSPDDIATLIGLVRNPNLHPAISSLALVRLWQVDPKEGLQAAEAILLDFLSMSAEQDQIRKKSQVVFGLRLLAATGSLTEKRALDALQHAIKLEAQGVFADKEQLALGFADRSAPILETCIHAAVRCGDDRVTPVLLDLLQANRNSVRIHVAKALGTLAEESTVPHIVAALGDKDPWVRVFLAQALKIMSGEDDETDWYAGSPGHRSKGIRFWKRKMRDLFDQDPLVK